MSRERTIMSKKKSPISETKPATAVDPAVAVNAALDYCAYAADWKLAVKGESTWAAKFGSRAKGDELLGRLETETRPDACMRILSAEVHRLRTLIPQPATQP